MHTILPVPPRGDTTLLTDEGCGGPPKMRVVFRDRTVAGALASVPVWVWTRGKGDALILVHAAERLPLGIFRAWYMADDSDADDLCAMLYEEHADIAEWARGLKRDGVPLGRVVILDANGQEVTR